MVATLLRVLLLLIPIHAATAAEVSVSDAWARSTAEGQTATAVYMTLRSNRDVEWVGVTTTVAGAAAVHEMRMRDGMMTMRRISRLRLSGGKPLILLPGGYHVMLEGLKKPLLPGERIPLTLRLVDSDGAMQDVTVSCPVRAVTRDDAQ